MRIAVGETLTFRVIRDWSAFRLDRSQTKTAVINVFLKLAIGCVFLEKLSIGELAAAQSRLAVFVSNDTGPVHIAAAVGAPIVVLIGRTTRHAYIPLATAERLIFSSGVHTIAVEEVYVATRELFSAGRMATLFAS